MNVIIEQRPSEYVAHFWFKGGRLNGIESFQCIDHDTERVSRSYNFMTYDGIDEAEEHWIACKNCDETFDLSDYDHEDYDPEEDR